MRINRILEIVNQVIQENRKQAKVSDRGFFVANTKIEKTIGPYVIGTIDIKYIDSNKVIHDYSTTSITDRVLSTDRELFLDVLEEKALHMFLSKNPITILEDIRDGA